LTTDTDEQLSFLEEKYIAIYDSYLNGYNNTDMVQGSCMQSLSVRQKHWGTLHGNSKYSGQQLEEVLNLLLDTTFTSSKIAELTNVHISTVQYIMQGGHEWLHYTRPDIKDKLSTRLSVKEQAGTTYTNEQVLLCMKVLLDSPHLTFTCISEKCGVAKETVSAISAGRNFKALVLADPDLKERAAEYFELGKLAYTKKYALSISVEESVKIANVLIEVCKNGVWRSRDILHTYGISTTLARKVAEFNEKLFSDLIFLGYGNLIKDFISLRTTGKGARKIPTEIADRFSKILSRIG
jgi:hypothetical protein